MPITTSTGFLPLLLAVGLAACQSPSSPSPSPAPSAVQQPAAAPLPPAVFPPGVLRDYTLSGVVVEVTPTGEAPLEAAWVYCELCRAETHSWALTDADGFYSFTGVWTTPDVAIHVWFGKDGYADPPGVPLRFNQSGWRQVSLTGDTRFDVQLLGP